MALNSSRSHKLAVLLLVVTAFGVKTGFAEAQLPSRSGNANPPSALSREQRAGSVKRVFAKDSFWVKNWFRGYEMEPDLFIEPRHIAAIGSNVVVVDIGTREVRAFDMRSGANRLKMVATRGSGPGEFRRPSSVVAVPNGFAILDEGNARASAFDLRGKLMWDAPMPGGITTSMCMRADHHMIWKVTGVQNAVVESDTAGRIISRRSLSWLHDSANSIATSARMAGPSNSGECVMAREFGAEFAIIPVTGAPRSKTFVEYMAPPKVTTKAKEIERNDKTIISEINQQVSGFQSAMDAMVRGDTLIVRFGGNTTEAIRLLDYYLLPSGQYLYSRKLPGYVVSLAVAHDGSFIFGEILPEYAGVGSLRPSLEPPPKKVEKRSGKD